MAKKGMSREEVKPLLSRVINIQFTPFKSATEIDVDALRTHTNYIIEGGIVSGKGVTVIGGSNGEGFSLSDDEYHTLIDVTVEAAAGRVPVVVGVVRPATQPVIELAKYAEELKEAGLASLTPPGWRPDWDPVLSQNSTEPHFARPLGNRIGRAHPTDCERELRRHDG